MRALTRTPKSTSLLRSFSSCLGHCKLAVSALESLRILLRGLICLPLTSGLRLVQPFFVS
jgi:hypothetical protein